jgi:hypothetical protein
MSNPRLVLFFPKGAVHVSGSKIDKEELLTELVKSALEMASVASYSLSTLENPDVQNVAKWMLLPDNQNPTSDLSIIKWAQGRSSTPLPEINSKKITIGVLNNIIVANMATQVNNDDPNTAVGTFDFVRAKHPISPYKADSKTDSLL